ncbi:MAG: 50S ribosomal protein L22, partial [SAR324 cluster bacterium]|nr:50S ribosomal protein L22 [SAR324 cluster bacterium]
MSNTKYSYQGEKEGTASVFARGVRISFKESYEIANELRGKTVAKAQKFLSDVLELKAAVPYRRYNHGVPHRTGIGPGRFPKNASERFLKAVNEVEANAEAKGLNTSNLRLIHVS